jgi:hypothetical protein
MDPRLSHGARHDGARGGGAVLLFQMEEVAVVTEMLKSAAVLRGFHAPSENQRIRHICTNKI